MTILERLFGSPARVRLMRLFYLNPDKPLAMKEISKMAKLSRRAISKENKLLSSIGFLKKSGKRGFAISETFPLFSVLRNLVITASPASRENLLNFFKKHKKIKLVSIGGVFLDSASGESKLDLLIVGNGIKKSAVEKFVKKMEPDIGKEINWSFLSLAEFNDRVAMHDKFLRDFFDSPNECLVNKISAEERA